MKITVFGSTGGTGKEVVMQALDRGHQVLAFARRPQELAVELNQSENINLQIVQGDVLDLASVSRALSGADAAISALGVRLGEKPGTTRSQGSKNIVRALTDAGIKRFVSVSTVAAGDSRERLSFAARILLPRIIGGERLAEAELQEAAIKQSTLDWTILRPARLLDGEGSGTYKMATDIKTGLNSSTFRSDLARALLDTLEGNKFLRQCPTVVS